MRPFHLKLVATGLLTVCALLIIRQTVWHDFISSKPTLTESPVVPSRSRDSFESTAGNLPHAAHPAKAATPGDRQPAPPASPSAAATSEPAPASVPIATPRALGVRLGDDVQLPAVILALSDPNRDPGHKTPAPVAAAMQAIVDRFYQDLTASVRDQSAKGNVPSTQAPDATVPEVGNEDTVVIEPGPAVDKARARANETYRTLFGDDAYNRLTMGTAIEVKLPVASAGDKP